MAQDTTQTAHIHPSYFVNLVAALMEAVHVELVRLATELEAVKGHREAGRHLPQQFGGSRLDCGDIAFFGWRAMRQSYHVMDRVVRC